MPVHSKYLRRIFLDTEDLSVRTDNFWEEIKQELKAARYLLVLCSTHSAKPLWVSKEIEAFLETHTEENILPVALDGCDSANTPVLIQPILRRNISLWDERKKLSHAANEAALFKMVEFFY